MATSTVLSASLAGLLTSSWCLSVRHSHGSRLQESCAYKPQSIMHYTSSMHVLYHIHDETMHDTEFIRQHPAGVLLLLSMQAPCTTAQDRGHCQQPQGHMQTAQECSQAHLHKGPDLAPFNNLLPLGDPHSPSPNSQSNWAISSTSCRLPEP